MKIGGETEEHKQVQTLPVYLCITEMTQAEENTDIFVENNLELGIVGQDKKEAISEDSKILAEKSTIAFERDVIIGNIFITEREINYVEMESVFHDDLELETCDIYR